MYLEAKKFITNMANIGVEEAQKLLSDCNELKLAGNEFLAARILRDVYITYKGMSNG